MVRRRHLLALAAGPALAGSDPMDSAAESYVKLVLALGRHDPDYVDAYYGPREWKEEAERESRPPGEIRRAAEVLADRLAGHAPSGSDDMVALRHRYLAVQTRSLARRAAMLEGEKLSFDAESQALYDAVAPSFAPGHFDGPLETLEKLLPAAS